MSRSARRRKRAGPTSRLSRSRGGAPRWVVWAAAGVALGVGIALALRRHAPAPEASGPDTEAARAAYDSAMTLGHQGRYLSSLPFFRRALAGRPDLSFVRGNYAKALFDAAYERRLDHGELRLVASSLERVRLTIEGLRQIDTAEVLTREPRERARLGRDRALALEAWGLPWNAFVAFRGSEWADTTWHESAQLADDYMDLMEHPTRARQAADDTLPP